MKKLTILLAGFAFLAVEASALDETKASTYEMLVETLENHPALEAARQAVIQQNEAANGAGGLPDPMLMLGINNYPVNGGGFDRFAMTSKSIGFVQKLPNGGVRAASVFAKKKLAEKAEIAVEFTRQKLIVQLNTALADNIRISEERGLIRQDIKLLKQERAFWGGRLHAGESALDELSRTEAELAQAEAKIARLEAEETAVTETLKQLTGAVEPSSLPALAMTPQKQGVFPVILAEKDIHIALANTQKADAAFGPNYQLGVTYAQRDDSGNFDGTDFASVQLGVSVPLWAGSNQEPKLRAAQAGVKRAEALYRDAQNQWTQKLAVLRAQIHETEATEKALDLKARAIQSQIYSLRSAYESNGRLDQLIAAKRSRLGLQVQITQLKARYVKQISTYNAYFTPKEGYQ